MRDKSHTSRGVPISIVTRLPVAPIVSLVATLGGIALLVVGAPVTAETVNTLSLDASTVGLARAAAGLAAAVAGCVLLLTVARRDAASSTGAESGSVAAATHIWEW